MVTDQKFQEKVSQYSKWNGTSGKVRVTCHHRTR